ncbi:MAG: BadF/BadG/BcrA/BcrD ATPase family protein [Polyangiaceae bacterium]
MARHMFLGVDVGAETVKVVAIEEHAGQRVVTLHRQAPHGKDPHAAFLNLMAGIDVESAGGIAVTGRLSRVLTAPSVPTKAALRKGVRASRPALEAVTVVSVGARGFSVLELGASGEDWFKENSRCSQGTGNFLSQLVARFGLSVDEASALCENVDDPAQLSGRCPVILKTDMTHLANKGEGRAQVIAGLYDAVSENVLSLVRPRLAPRNVVLTGGVCRSARIRKKIDVWLRERGMHLVAARAEDSYLEALGAATHALEHPCSVPSSRAMLASAVGSPLETVPALRAALDRVERLTKAPLPVDVRPNDTVLLGFDIGSTGSKVVAVDSQTRQVVWEAYIGTEGAPVGAAQRLMRLWVDGPRARVVGVGVTGSGREVVGSLLRTCYGDRRVFVMNEIAAHARGAAAIDPDVDTIFEIGGQDAKYIRLEGGRVIDAAMNEACSAGTGSFIAEQGTKFESVGQDIAAFGALALRADHGVSLGQHCSVFMAEVIDEAISQGVDRNAIVAGLYDSVIQNYLNRVKGPRSVGTRIFCQGMPFSSDALAAAVARQTGRSVVVPPNPGTIGAFGIALLAIEELGLDGEAIDARAFLEARIVSKETFVCPSTKGCGGTGNKCRIDRLKTDVGGVEQKFLWGGNCSLYDRVGARRKLPDLAPDTFAERERLVLAALAELEPADGLVVGLTDEFSLKGMLPLFVVFLRNLGIRTEILRHAGASTLRRGIEGARVPYCAPMQLFHGACFDLASRGIDALLIPMLRELPSVADEEDSVLCPIVQASPDLVSNLVASQVAGDAPRQPRSKPTLRILRPVIRFDGQAYEGGAFRAVMKRLAADLGAEARFDEAFRRATLAQNRFDEQCLEIGSRALAFCRREGIVPVAVLGRPYTIHNDVLNSNVPSILRSLGAMPIPVDCLPNPPGSPTYHDQYWAFSQRNLRAADTVRRTPGLYSVFCSNYACGPDSFTLQFYTYVMRGKPFAVVETDGHSGDAGTKTRMEAFLYCVDTDMRTGASTRAQRTDITAHERAGASLRDARERDATVLLPRMGPQAEIAAASLRAEGLHAEALPMSTRDDVRTGRRHTSGKECVPMILTLGTLLNRLERDAKKDTQFVFLMPTARGPCRFGVYNTLHKIALEQAGWGDRVSVFSPDDGDYFRDTSPAFAIRTWIGFLAHDLLQTMLLDVRPVERTRGAADRAHDAYFRELIECMERRPARGTVSEAVQELFGGLFGARDVLTRAAAEMAEIKNPLVDAPTVGVVGEIYVRLDPFANDFLIEKLEARGIRVRFAPFVEWLEYTSYLAEKRWRDGRLRQDDRTPSILMTGLLQRATAQILYDICRERLDWGPRLSVTETVSSSLPYIDSEFAGEACLTVGGPLHELHEHLIQGVVVVGPHECMPHKIAEAQLGAAGEHLPLPCLSISVNGDPIDTEALDRFAYDIHEGHRRGLARNLGSILAPERPGGQTAAVGAPLVQLRLNKGRRASGGESRL